MVIYIIILFLNAKANREGGLQVELTSSTASDLGREIDDDDDGQWAKLSSVLSMSITCSLPA